MEDDLVDRIYEAAFVPELWSDVLERLAALSGSAAGSVLAYDHVRPVGFRTVGPAQDILEQVLSGEVWETSRRIEYFYDNPISGFVVAQDYYPAEIIGPCDPSHALRQRGLESQAGTIIPMPSGELVVFVFEKWARDGRFSAGDIARLNRAYPHLARAGLVAARLGLEQARTTVSTLQSVGLPAAALAFGRVLVANSLFDAMPDLFVHRAGGRLALSDLATDELFQEAVAPGRDNEAVRSIPIPAREGGMPLIVHVLPLRRAARDIFPGADILVAATTVSPSAMVPSPTILTGLFDLTPAEARLAVSLVAGMSLKAAAVASGVTFSTARTYLDRIYRKTGVNRQGQLVALLKSAQPFRP
ncbi:MAG TPA: helix-turn-helix transcriptional regulator [Rhizobiaceae bacterium]